MDESFEAVVGFIKQDEKKLQTEVPGTRVRRADAIARYGAQYFLAEIWVAGARLGRHLPKSSREKELAKDLAQNARQRRDCGQPLLTK